MLPKKNYEEGKETITEDQMPSYNRRNSVAEAAKKNPKLNSSDKEQREGSRSKRKDRLLVPPESDTQDDTEPEPYKERKNPSNRQRNDLRRQQHSHQPTAERLPEMVPKRRQWDRPPNLPPTPQLKN